MDPVARVLGIGVTQHATEVLEPGAKAWEKGIDNMARVNTITVKSNGLGKTKPKSKDTEETI
jgi:hypothetical protein